MGVRVHDHESEEEVVPREDERVGGGGEQARDREREHDVPEHAHEARAVDVSGRFEVDRDRAVEVGQHPGRERDREARVHDDQADVGVVQVQLDEHDEHRHHERDRGDRVAEHEERRGHPATVEAQAGEREGRRRADEQRDDRRRRRDEEAVPDPVQQARPSEREPVAAGVEGVREGLAELQREEVLGILERRDEDPEERKDDYEDDERREDGQQRHADAVGKRSAPRLRGRVLCCLCGRHA